MYILYVDESGTQELKAKPNHFVLLGLMISADDWKRLDREIDLVKEKYDLSGVEIHTAWMRRRYSEQEKITNFEKMNRNQRLQAVDSQIRQRSAIIGVEGNRLKIKHYRREVKSIEPYLHLTRKERLDCIRLLAEYIGKWQDARIFADAISKADYKVKKATPYEAAFEQVLTRYQAYLEKANQNGIVVHDNNDTVAPRLTKLTREYHKVGTFYRRIKNIIETPLFVDSSLTSMIQMADICAYSLRRFIENDETELWNLVKSRVDKMSGVDVGLRHYTGRRQCKCVLCQAHGRNKQTKTEKTPQSSSTKGKGAVKKSR